MSEITLSLSYYNDFEHLRQHLEQWKAYKDKIEFQIIDDGSKEKLVDKIDIDLFLELNISIYRINQDIKWNIPGVRNLGAVACTTKWILFCDMDQYFHERDIPLDFKQNEKIKLKYFKETLLVTPVPLNNHNDLKILSFTKYSKLSKKILFLSMSSIIVSSFD